MHRLRALTSHTLVVLAETGLVAALVVGMIAGTAFAAKGGGHGGGGNTGGTGTITLVLMNGATAPQFGGQVTFNVSTTSTTSPFVNLVCYQNGQQVSSNWQGFFDGAMGNQWFYLGPSPSWSGGAATCTAYLDKYTGKGWSVLASTSFSVAG